MQLGASTCESAGEGGVVTHLRPVVSQSLEVPTRQD